MRIGLCMLALLLAFSVMVGLTGCGRNVAEDGGSTTTTTTTTTTTRMTTTTPTTVTTTADGLLPDVTDLLPDVTVTTTAR